MPAGPGRRYNVGMASHAERRAAARLAREVKEARRDSTHTRNLRLAWLGGVAGVVVVALVLVIVLSPGGSNKPKAVKTSSTVASVEALLGGIHQSGMTLGNANAPVTITEFSDLVCPDCAAFATAVEPDLIKTEVRTGHASLVARGLETASGAANGSAFDTSQTAIRSAGLQARAWDYILIAYDEQPQTINGQAAEDVPYVTTGYLQKLAAQIPGLNLVDWQANLTSQTLIDRVNADAHAANAASLNATPSFIVKGPKGSVSVTGAVSLSQLQATMSRVGG